VSNKKLVDIVDRASLAIITIDDAQGEVTPLVEKALEELEELGIDFADKLGAYAHVAEKMDAEAALQKARADKASAKCKSIQRAAEYMRVRMLDAMIQVGTREVVSVDYTIKIRKLPEKVVIEDGATLSDDYMDVKTVITPKKKALKEALKNGIEIEGCSLVSGEKVVF
jgi:hypothetical protein